MKFFRIPFNPEDGDVSESRSNRLYKYIQSQSPQDMARLASEISPEVKQIVAANVQTLLGYLPPQEFSTTVMASKENLQNLLASAMLTGYFMHAMENRMLMDALFAGEKPAEESPNVSADTSDANPSTLEELLKAEDEAPNPRPAKPLQNPRDLFAGLDALIEGPPEKSTRQKLEDLGRFLRLEELKKEQASPEPDDQKMNIQLEINTRMDRAELTELLRELRKFQAPEEAANSEEPDLDEL